MNVEMEARAIGTNMDGQDIQDNRLPILLPSFASCPSMLNALCASAPQRENGRMRP